MHLSPTHTTLTLSMEPTLFSPLLFSLFVLLLGTSSAEPLQYQTLLLTPLSNPPTRSTATQTELTTTTTESENTLTLPLEHRDSFSSVSSNQTPESIFKLRLDRDAARVKSIQDLVGTGSKNVTFRPTGASTGDFSSSIISGLAQGSGEYFTRLGIGTPPRYSYMVLDTGSDIVWLQCLPCRKCYSQSDRIFDPKKSTSYAVQSCGSPLCRKLDVSGCNQRRSCLYQVSYGDGSFTVGEFATETVTFRGTKVPNVAFGCGHDNEGLFVGAAGLLGLGRGKLSFLGQMGTRFGQKFSYCLVDRTAGAKPSSIVFGNSAVSKVAVFTPMITNPKLDTFYYLELVGISVGGNRVAGISSSLFKLDPAGNGGVIIDSGTSVTRLTRQAYVALRDAFRTGTTGLKRAPGFSLFDTCYDLAGKTTVKVPTVVMHFGRGADVSFPASNYLIPVDTSGVFCFAFAATSGGLSIIGNIQQQGFRVVFDGAASRIGFTAHGCA